MDQEMTKRSYTDEEAAWMRNEYESESQPSIRNLATKYDRTPDNVRNMLLHAGTELRLAGFHGSYGTGTGKKKTPPTAREVCDRFNRFEWNIARLIAQRCSNEEIATELHLTNREVHNTLLRIINKLGKVVPECVNRQALISVVRSLGLHTEAEKASMPR
jgi:DNA-binding NarL/FixJ family response regulator